jgi:hypothetical protein
MKGKVTVTKGTMSATDHLPIMAGVMTSKADKAAQKAKPRLAYKKRSMKDFKEIGWNQSLAKQDWEKMGRTENAREMAKIMNVNITNALDECAPFITEIVRHSYRCGISKETKDLNKSRDQTRNPLITSGNV